MIDLRSDTVTRPTPAMRAAMANAEVGDDVFCEDPTVQRLEAMAAERLGMEASLFVPTGTMGNQIAVNLHTRPGQEVILEERSHIFNYELAGMAVLSGVIPRPLPGKRGMLTVEQVRAAVRPDVYYITQTGLIALENTHNMAGGTIFPREEAKKILDFAHDAGIPVHLDGARIFNAAVAVHAPPARLVAGFDSVMVCLSKGLAAPVGSLLVGRKAFVEKARIVRKRFGGGMRQVGVLAAAGIVALETMVERLDEDHANAKRLAEGLQKIRDLALMEDVETNIVIFNISKTGMDSGKFLARLKERGVLGVPVSPAHVRFVTHCDVTAADMDAALAAVEEVCRG